VENKQEKEPIQKFLNKFEVLKDKVTKIGENSRREIRKDRKMVLREKGAKKEKLVKVQKTRVENSNNSVEKKKKLLREIRVKIRLK